MKKILLAASEAVPFIKTGGLADVAGALPKYIDKRKADVRVILPKYLCMNPRLNEELTYRTHFYMDLSWRSQYVGILEAKYDGVTFYFIDNEYYFGGFAPYGEMYTDVEKFAFFSKAVLSSLPLLDFKPDIIHCNDWQTALVPVYLKTLFAEDPFFWGIKTIMTVHNLRFQGRWDLKSVQDITGLPDHCFTGDGLEAYEDANLMKGALLYSDLITTVSPTYAGEIQTMDYGEGLDAVLRYRSGSMRGVLNGIDDKVYDPRHDELLEVNYGIPNHKKGKAANKAALQKQLGLTVSDEPMLIGIVSRLTDQKGLDLVGAIFDQLLCQPIQFICVGTGEGRYEDLFRHYAGMFPDKVSANITYSDELAHRVFAGTDLLLVPSLFEPCGLTQMFALRYGSVPLVRETGGLADTVEAYNKFESTGNGFSFADYRPEVLLQTICQAIEVRNEYPEEWSKLIVRGMKADHSWKKAVKEYEKIYTELLEG